MNQDGDGGSSFSMKGVFGALKKAVVERVKAKFHELTDEIRQSFKIPASEQQYAEHVSTSTVNVDPTSEELNDVAKAASRLWDLDVNRLTPGTDYEIDLGGGTKVYQKDDHAEAVLFRHLDQSVFRRPTYARFYALLDNYHSDERVAENITSQQQNEELAFIEEISRTAPIKYLHKYLEAKNIIRGDEEQFKTAMRSLWFDLYNRGGTRGSSSAFEHVFVGELKRDRNTGETEVSGMHNWIQVYVEEAKGNLDYQGFILPRRRGDPLPNAHSQLVTLQFKWNGVLKAVSSTLIGVSPEFEMALYTVCFFCGAEDNHVNLGPYYVNVKVYPLGNNCIGSAFPIAEE
ncbi:unnamed protein product [Calypogeia fissa]